MKAKKKSITKSDLSEALYKKLGYSKQFNSELLEELLSLMKGKFKKGIGLKIHGFGKFAVKAKKARTGRNPATGRPINIKARRVLTFRPAGALRKLFKKPAKNKG